MSIILLFYIFYFFHPISFFCFPFLLINSTVHRSNPSSGSWSMNARSSSHPSAVQLLQAAAGSHRQPGRRGDESRTQGQELAPQVEEEGCLGAPSSRSRRRLTSRHAQPWRRLRHRSASSSASPRDELPTPRRGTSSRRRPASRRAPSQHKLPAPPGLPRRRGTSSDRRLASRSAAARAPFAPSRRERWQARSRHRRSRAELRICGSSTTKWLQRAGTPRLRRWSCSFSTPWQVPEPLSEPCQTGLLLCSFHVSTINLTI